MVTLVCWPTIVTYGDLHMARSSCLINVSVTREEGKKNFNSIHWKIPSSSSFYFYCCGATIFEKKRNVTQNYEIDQRPTSQAGCCVLKGMAK